MFDPDLWRRTKASAIALLILGSVLLVPAGYVFFLAAVVLRSTGAGFALSGGESALFWSALTGSSSGVLAWIALCLLLFQRRDIRIHLLAWHLVRGAGLVIIPCLGFWAVLIGGGSAFRIPGKDAFIFLGVLLAILGAALLLVWIGQRNLGLARAAAMRTSVPSPSA